MFQKKVVAKIKTNFDVTTSYNSVDTAAWLGKVTSQRQRQRAAPETRWRREPYPWQRKKNNMAARI
jgi:hypothetical protein